ncbi:MAG: hypothetical protein KC503_47495 [Myxococcales bacterium]|nr:hypothetical protein [Myxococcales bacterium]
MLRHLDRPLLAGRTARELLLVGGALTVTIAQLARSGLSGNVGNLVVYLAFAAALWLRFYAARALLVGLVVAAMAQVLPQLRAHHAPLLMLAAHKGLVLAWVGGLLLLCSRDLVARYDRAPSRHRPFPNFWAAVDPRDARWLRGCGYALAACIGASVSIWRLSAAPPAWLLPVIVALSVAVALLCLGRAVVLVVLPLMSLVVVLLFASVVGVAEAQLSSRYYAWGLIGAPAHVLPAMIAAAAAGLLALPYSLRVLSRARARG